MGDRLSPSAIDQVRCANDIVEVIGAHLALKRAGANFIGLCPFHKEKTPSFNVNPQRQIFHCFGCHKGGDVIAFVRDYENLDFIEAVRRLAERAGMTLVFDGGGTAGAPAPLKESLWQIHEQITQRWQSALANEACGQAGRDYLAQRQISAEAIQLFRLGYAPEAWDDTVNWARGKGWDGNLVEQAGLIVRREGETRYYDRFRGRLMFPICDEIGRVIAFSGRILSAEANVAKYVNSPETPIFSKRKVIYGLDKAKRSIIDAHSVLLCEGQLDMIACHMAGVRNAVAPQGTAFTSDHARLLKRFADEVILCFDSDSAGQKATVRALDDLLAVGLSIRVARLPAPHDPDSFIKAQGGEAFQAILRQAEGFFDFYLRHLGELHDLSSDQGRVALARAMGEAVGKTGSALLLDTYAQKTALQLRVSVDAIRREFARASALAPTSRKSMGDDSPAPERPYAPPSPLEYWLLKLLFCQDSPYFWLAPCFEGPWLQHDGVRQIVDLYLAALHEDPWPGSSRLAARLTESPLQTLLTEAMADPRSVPNPRQQLVDVLQRLRNQHLDREIQTLMRQASRPDLSEEERLRWSAEIIRLRQAKKKTLPAGLE